MGVKKRVLLIDDDESILSALGDAIQSEGYEVVAAHDAEEALPELRIKECDIALFDVNMPFKRGRKTFEQLSSADPFLPIITIIAGPDQDFMATAPGVGALMEKPLDLPLLFKIMGELIREAARRRAERLDGNGPPARFPDRSRNRPRQNSGRKKRPRRWLQFFSRVMDRSSDDTRAHETVPIPGPAALGARRPVKRSPGD